MGMLTFLPSPVMPLWEKELASIKDARAS